jgi:growth hormone-inducible transmembrane protein
VGVNYFLNRETRDALSATEREYLHSAFRYTAGGLVLTALGARALFRSGAAVRIMAANPCMFLTYS